MSQGCSEMIGRLDEWPGCIVADCPNKSCLSLASAKCWPHTVGLPISWADGLTEAQIGRKRRKFEQAYLERMGYVARKR